MLVEIDGTKTDIRIKAIMSVPRLGFMDNFTCWVKAFSRFGINIVTGTGAYWGQILQTQMEAVLDECDFIFTVDYDTFFRREDVETLVNLSVKNGLDAITGIQARRDDSSVMCHPPVEHDDPRTLIQVESAHFGLTLIRCSSLRMITKPWFAAIPNTEGRWTGGHLDADMFFWKKFTSSGCRVWAAPKIKLGHGEYMVLWPDGNMTFARDF